MTAREILSALRALGVALGVTDGKIELSAPTAPPAELVDAVRQGKPGVMALLVGAKELFKRPQPKPPVKVEYDLRDRGPNSHLSAEAKAAGVTCPGGEGNRGGRSW